MISRNVILLIVAALVIVGAAFALVGRSGTATESQPSPHAIDQNP